MNRVIDQFRVAISAAGISPPEDILADSKLHRFASNGKRGDDAGYYVLHNDGIPAGMFGCWRSDIKQTWRADIGRELTPAEEAAHKAKIDAAQRQRAEEQERRQAEAAQKAAELWKASSPGSSTNPYLKRKQVSCTDTLREIDAAKAAEILGYPPKCRGEPLTGRLLIVPVKVGDSISTLELIDGQGRKAALAGGAKAGGYWAAQKLPEADGSGLTLMILEGVATALSSRQVTGHPVLAALSCGNLKAVALAMRERYPKAAIIVIGDLGNGQEAASDAARAAGALLALPDFGDKREDGDSDMKDLWKRCGGGAVYGALQRAKTPDAPAAQPTPANALAVDSSGSALLDPIPLPKLPPVPELPPELLPDALRAWIMDAADRARFDASFMAASAMVGLGSLIGRKLGIRLKQHDDWTEYANVWGCIIGTPSALKSPAMRDGLRSVKQMQFAADTEHDAAMREWEAAAEAHKLRRSADKKAAVKRLEKDRGADINIGDDGPPEKPIGRCYWTSDATVERLGEMAVENPNGLLIVRDELSSLLKALEDEQKAEARGFYLSGWSGKEGYRFDRIMRGTTYIPAYALSIIGGIQPGPLSRFVRAAQSGEQADGLLQRLQLIVWPDTSDFEYVDRWADSDFKRQAFDVFQRADQFDGGTIGEAPEFGDDPPFIHLDPEAQELFVGWYTQFMQSHRVAENDGSEAGPLAAHFGKYPGLLGKLALILHVCDDPNGRAVSRRTLLKALAWLNYLEPHARRVYHAAYSPETQAAELLIARIRSGKLPAQFKSWEIARNCWHGLTDRDAVKKACRLLHEHRWLIEVDGGEPGKIGRPADPMYTANPAALTK